MRALLASGMAGLSSSRKSAWKSNNPAHNGYWSPPAGKPTPRKSRSFGNHGHTERFAQGFDRARRMLTLAARALVDVGDEGAIDVISSAVMSASAESEE